MTDVEKNQLVRAIFDLEKVSREVGFLNAVANTVEYDENGNESYDLEAIDQYEELRGKQIKMLNALVEKISTTGFLTDNM
jgi:hypothetical protein